MRKLIVQIIIINSLLAPIVGIAYRFLSTIINTKDIYKPNSKGLKERAHRAIKIFIGIYLRISFVVFGFFIVYLAFTLKSDAPFWNAVADWFLSLLNKFNIFN